MKPVIYTRWAVKWRTSGKNINGARSWFLYADGEPALFRTRATARAWAKEWYGYIKTRADLRAAPHGWLAPRLVRVVVRIAEK